MTDTFCPMIHGGLNIDLKLSNELNQTTELGYNQCCLSNTPLTFVNKDSIDWNGSDFTKNRTANDNNQWLSGCYQCLTLEKVGLKSFRKSMLEKFGVHKNLSGPQRIDLLFDRSCNLACRTCGPRSSTLWSKHLKENNLPVFEIIPTDNTNRITNILESLNLNNLEMVQFCGGETLLGNTYWKTAQWLAEHVPNAKTKLELAFQTNGTQSIDPQWYDVIEKFKLVKLMISIDGIGDKFEYLRWPASWNQTVDNILTLRENLPSNVMFFVQECTSCLNLYYFDQVSDWVKQNFNSNRDGDPIGHSTQLAMHSYLHPRNITQEYANAIAHTPSSNVIGKYWQEDPEAIKQFVQETAKFDIIRNQDWKKTFPEVAEFYKRYL